MISKPKAKQTEVLSEESRCVVTPAPVKTIYLVVSQNHNEHHVDDIFSGDAFATDVKTKYKRPINKTQSYKIKM
jgi:hypothetical protein